MNQDMNTLEHYRKRAEAAETELQKLREQEPVAWCYWQSNGDGTESRNQHYGRELPSYIKPSRGLTALYAAPVPPPDVEAIRRVIAELRDYAEMEHVWAYQLARAIGDKT